MVKSILARATLVLIDDQKLLNQIFAFVTDCSELSVLEVILGALDLTEHFSSILALEWEIATNESVEDDAKRPDIGLL